MPLTPTNPINDVPPEVVRSRLSMSRIVPTALEMACSVHDAEPGTYCWPSVKGTCKQRVSRAGLSFLPGRARHAAFHSSAHSATVREEMAAEERERLEDLVFVAPVSTPAVGALAERAAAIRRGEPR